MLGFFVGVLFVSSIGKCCCCDCNGCSYSCGGCYNWSWCCDGCCGGCGDGGFGLAAADNADHAPGQALIVVSLPEKAGLFVNGQKIDLPSAKRQILTPALESGRDYLYTVKTTVLQDGKPVEKVKQVAFRAGQVVAVNMDEATSRFTVRLPENARLTVNGVAHPAKTEVRSFAVPELERGQKYFYTFRAEVVRDGKQHAETRQVVFEGGKPVDVDFRGLDPVLTARK